MEGDGGEGVQGGIDWEELGAGQFRKGIPIVFYIDTKEKEEEEVPNNNYYYYYHKQFII